MTIVEIIDYFDGFSGIKQVIKTRSKVKILWIFGFLAILYNPIIPVHLYEKEIWMVVNIVTSIIFLFKGINLIIFFIAEVLNTEN